LSFFYEKFRADQDAANCEKDVNADSSMLNEPVCAEVAKPARDVMMDHHTYNRQRSPSI
jgi:hypothetical protein